MILLHGIGSRGVSWIPIIDCLATRFRLIVPDLRGHGDSDKPPTGYLIDDYVSDLDGLISTLGLERPMIIGHSLGALIALYWAAKWPDRAARIVLEDPPLRPDPGAGDRFDRWLTLATTPTEVVARDLKQKHPDWSDADCLRRAESITSTAPGVFTELRPFAMCDDREAALARLPAVRTPILVTYGDTEAGSVVHPEDVARVRSLLPTVTWAHIPGGGHFLHRDLTEPFLAAVLPFLHGGDGSER